MKKIFVFLLVGMFCSLLLAQDNDETITNAIHTQASPNLLANPGFESGTTSWYGDRCSISATTKTKYSGYKALYVSSRQSYLAGPAQYVTSLIKNGASYNIEAWAKNYSGSAYIRATLVVKAGTQTLYFRTPTFVVGSSGWKKISGTVQPKWTGTLTSASFRIETSSGTGRFYADAVLLTENRSYATKYPFPYSQPGLLGIKPTGINASADISAFYSSWKSSYVKTQTVSYNGSNVTVSYVEGGTTGDISGEWGNSYYAITASEHTGYGMLISVIMDDKTTFDQIVNLYDIFRSSASTNLMSWAVPAKKSDGKIVTNLNRVSDAPDGDLDIAYALLMAYYQWEKDAGGTAYLNKATAMIKDLNDKLVYGEHPRIYWLKVADDVSDSEQIAQVTRPSDFMISHLKAFSAHAPNDANQLSYAATDMWTILDMFWSEKATKTGLVSDFLDINGQMHFVPASNTNAYIAEMGEDHPDKYSWNACRVPMRLALAYRFGESYVGPRLSATDTNLRGMVDWLWKDVAKVSANPSTWQNKIKGTIKLDGTFIEDDVNNSFIAPFVAGCIIDSKYQAELNAGWNYIKTNKVNYYDDTLTLLSMMVASGYWWMPK